MTARGWWIIHYSHRAISLLQQLVRSWFWIFWRTKTEKNIAMACSRSYSDLWDRGNKEAMHECNWEWFQSAIRSTAPWAVLQRGQCAQVAAVAFHQQEKLPWQRGAGRSRAGEIGLSLLPLSGNINGTNFRQRRWQWSSRCKNANGTRGMSLSAHPWRLP